MVQSCVREQHPQVLFWANGPRLRKNRMRTWNAFIGKLCSLYYSPSQMYILRSGGCTDTDKIISRTIWQGNDDFLQQIQEKGTVNNNEGYMNIVSHLGWTSQRAKFTPYPSPFSFVSHSFMFARIRHLNLFLLLRQAQPPKEKNIRQLLWWLLNGWVVIFAKLAGAVISPDKFCLFSALYMEAFYEVAPELLSM